LAGDAVRASTVAGDLEKRFREDTEARFVYVPSIRALAALAQGDSAHALELLKATAPYDLGVPLSAATGFYGAMYPVYARGLAYLAAHRGAEAAAEFRRIVDHRGIVVSDTIGAVARLQLGRALAMAGDKAAARAAYQDFLDLWSAADADAPPLVQARRELAALP